MLRKYIVNNKIVTDLPPLPIQKLSHIPIVDSQTTQHLKYEQE